MTSRRVKKEGPPARRAFQGESSTANARMAIEYFPPAQSSKALQISQVGMPLFDNPVNYLLSCGYTESPPEAALLHTPHRLRAEGPRP